MTARGARPDNPISKLDLSPSRDGQRSGVLILGTRRRTIKYAAGDSSGFDARHASRYYVHRRDNRKDDANRPKKRVSYKRFGKLMVIVCCATHAIVGAVRRQAQPRARLRQGRFILLHAQLVILLLELRDALPFVNHRAEINCDRLQAARHFHAHGHAIVRGERAVDGHGFADRHLGHFGGLNLSRLGLAVRAGGLSGSGIVALAGSREESERDQQDDRGARGANR